ncbi:MAG: ISAs1 family transposase [Bacteroidota bacterium]
MNGKKESEKTCVQQLLAGQALLKQKVTADALHLSPTLTTLIEQEGGKYLIGLKKNQKGIYEDMESASRYLAISKQQTTLEKGHGRIETRHYQQYDISKLYFDRHWQKSGFHSLFKVDRKQVEIKTDKEFSETAYYISNVEPNKNDNYFQVIRKHWSVEVCKNRV